MKKSTAIGIWQALLATSIWGSFPLYFYQLKAFSPWLIVCMRVLLSLIPLMPFLFNRSFRQKLLQTFSNKVTVFWLFLSALTLFTNWLFFVIATTTSRASDASFGYFIYPLLAVALGRIFFQERLNKLEGLSVSIIAVAVIYLFLFFDDFPWLGIGVALSFSFYILLRKKIPVESVMGLFVENILLVPLAILFISLTWRPSVDELLSRDFFWLLWIGPLTVGSLMSYIAATRHLKLSLTGMLFYWGPSLQLLSALYLGESISNQRWVAFCLIWLALFLYSLGQRRPALLKLKDRKK